MKRYVKIFAILSSLVFLAGCANSESPNAGEAVQNTSETANESGGQQEESVSDENPAEIKEGEYVGFDGVDTDISAEITIYRYYADSDKANVDGALEKMKQKYPDLTINIENRGAADGSELKTWAAVGELPDIFEFVSLDAYEALISNGDVYPLDDAVKATGFYDYFTNGEATEERHTHDDGHQYSMSCEAGYIMCLWYNKEVFAELGLSEPTNYEEFKNSIEVLKDAGKIPFALFGSEQWPAMSTYALAVVAEGEYGGVDVLDTGEATVADTAFRNAAQKFEEVINMGVFGTGALSTNYQQATEMLASGQAGYMLNGMWFWQTIEDEGLSDKVGWCHYNVFADAEDAEEVKGHCVGGNAREQYHSVNANPPSGLDPYVLALLQCEFEYYVRLSSAEKGDITTVKGDFEFSGSDIYKDFNEHYVQSKSYNTSPPDVPNAELVTSLGNALEMMVSGNYTADDFIADMTENGF